MFSGPGVPENLLVENVTSTCLRLQWDHPNMTNGVLRSFLISVEETEQYDQDKCCVPFPIIEIPATEHRHYNLEVIMWQIFVQKQSIKLKNQN